MNRLLRSTVALLTSVLAASAAQVPVDPRNAVIVTPDQPNAIVRYAAQELAWHLKQVSGTAVPVVTGAAPAGKFAFNVGIPHGVDARTLRRDEARYEIGSGGVWLFGQDVIRGKKAKGGSAEEIALAHDNEAGTLFAVYEFLEQALGVHWVEPGEQGVTFKPQTTFSFTSGTGAWASELVQRHMRTAYKAELRDRALEANVPADMKFSDEEFARRQHDEVVWQRRMRMGGDVNFTYGHAFRQWWAKYGKTHPEYFALGRNGKRGPESAKGADRVKMCVSNPDLVKQIVADHFAANRGLVVNACENDSRNFCRCPQCMALDVVLPGEENLDVDDRMLTDRYVHFTNAVLREAKKHDPRAKTVFYAYSRYNLPPRRERLDDDVIVFLLPNLAMTKQELTDYYAAWRKANAREVYMRPNDLCQDTGLPLGFEQHMFEKFQMAGQGMSIRGTDYDTCWGFWPVSGFANYVMARAFYRPERSFADWDKEYCATFGAAAPDVAAYQAYWRQIWNQRVMGNLDRINKITDGMKLLRNKMANLADRLYDEVDFDRTDAMLQAALKRELTAQERRRVETLALANQHNRLTFEATAANRAASPVPDEQKKRATQALYDFRRQHRTDLNMHWELLFWLENAYCDNAGFERLLGTEKPALRKERVSADEIMQAGLAADPKPLR